MAIGKSIKVKKELNYGIINIEHPELYIPWIHAREMSSGAGRRHVFNDVKYPQRAIHLFSDLEKAVYDMLHGNEMIKELFEQVALDMEATKKIADELGITHPKNPKTYEEIVMTTDFVAFIDNGIDKPHFTAYSVKYECDLKKKRTREKLKLEKEYWNQQEVEWFLITEKEVFQYRAS